MRAYRNGTLEEYLRDYSCAVEDCNEPRNRYNIKYCARHQKQVRRRGRIILHEVYEECQWCGVASGNKFCSNSCSGKYWRANPNNRTVIASYSARRRARKANAEGSHTVSEWESLIDRYDGVCLSCQSKGPLTRDHIVPLSKGGSDCIDNIQPLCATCNLKKSTQVIDYR